MSDIREIRAKLRNSHSPAPSGGGRFGFGLLVLAACAIAFGGVLLVPRLLSVEPTPLLVPLQPSAYLPTFKQVVGGAADTPAPRPQNIPNIVVSYEGKSAAEIGKAADDVCFQRAHARYPHWSKSPRLTRVELHSFSPGGDMDHFNELMHCLLTEGTQRYCSARDQRMIVDEIVMYFRGIAYFNQVIKQELDEAINKRTPRTPAESQFVQVQRELGGNTDYIRELQSAGMDVDQRVVAAIESLLRGGLLTRASRDEIVAAAPPAMRGRFARIDPPKSRCPDRPWWAFWREESAAALAPAPRSQNIPDTAVSYEGRNATEIGAIADEACYQRAQARYPHKAKEPRVRPGDNMFVYGDMDHFNELMQCLLTEGVRRYCSGSERRMITAEIVTYFRGIERGNLVLKAVRHKADEPPRTAAEQGSRETRLALEPDYIKDFKQGFADVEPDRGVITAIESRLRDGLLIKASRDKIAAAAPPAVRERFARIDPPKSTCPDEPWWAIWR